MHVDASEYCSAKRNKVKITPDFLSHPSNPETSSRKNVKYHKIIVQWNMSKLSDKVNLLMSHPKAYFVHPSEEER